MKLLNHISRIANDTVEKLLGILGLAMAVIVIAQVFSRYVLNHSLFWSEEMARYLLIWLTFLGASCGYYRKVHPGIDLFSTTFGEPLRKSLALAVHLVSLCFFCVMVYHGSAFAYFVRHQISAALALPKWIVFTVIPLSGALFILHGLVFLLAELQEGPRDN